VKTKIPGETKEERLQTFRKAFPDVVGQIAPGALAAATVKIGYDADPVDPGSVLLETARAVVPGIKAAVEAYQNEARPAARANPTIAEVIGEMVQAFPDAARSVFVLLVVPGLRIRAVSLLGADPDVTAECHGRWYVRDASRPGPPYERGTQEEAEALIRDLIENQQKAVFVRVST
jgi:hypothetical protein